MNSKKQVSWLLLLIPILFLLWYLFDPEKKEPLRHLPYFGPKHQSKEADTTYHSVGSFTFINQYRQPTTLDSIRGNVVLCEYFFVTCRSICPIMNSNLQKIYQEYAAKKDFLILSHTVDPEEDSVDVLRNYAESKGVRDRRWLFLTGDKKQLYEMARSSYLLNAEQGDGGPDDFIHTQNFALVDKDLHIRGFYDGTDSLEMSRLRMDLGLLFSEYDFTKDNPH